MGWIKSFDSRVNRGHASVFDAKFTRRSKKNEEKWSNRCERLVELIRNVVGQRVRINTKGLMSHPRAIDRRRVDTDDLSLRPCFALHGLRVFS